MTHELEQIRDLRTKALGYIQEHGFTLDTVGPLTPDADEITRWKVLAFSLYTDLVEASNLAEHLIETLTEE